jgi:hypothetical protein
MMELVAVQVRVSGCVHFMELNSVNLDFEGIYLFFGITLM